MKPMLRALLLVDALVWLVAAAFCLGAPWAPDGSVWQTVVPVDARLLAELFGVALLALVALRLAGVFQGGWTLGAARIVCHADWISGAAILVWLLAFHEPALSGPPQASAALVGVVLILLGLAQTRLALAMRRKQKLLTADAAMAGIDADRGVGTTTRRLAPDDAGYLAPTDAGYVRGTRARDAMRDIDAPATIAPGPAAPSRWRPFGRRASDAARRPLDAGAPGGAMAPPVRRPTSAPGPAATGAGDAGDAEETTKPDSTRPPPPL